jgi:DNA-binding NtrC family response regulator
MISASASTQRISAVPQRTPVVFVVDDDEAVRESLECLIRCEGWRAETFASAGEFLLRPRALTPSCLVLDVSLPDLNGPTCNGASPSIGRTCRSSSSPVAVMCR